MLLFIHGMWGSSKQWDNYINYFRERNIKAEAIDLKENIDIRKASIMDYVRKVSSIANKKILVGHSMGGLITQKVAEMTNIKGMVAIASAPPKGIKFKNKSMEIHSLKYFPSILLKKPLKPSYNFIKKYLLNCINEERAREIYASLTYESPIAAYEIFMNEIDVDERKINAPVLFIAGKNDKVAPPKLEEKIAKKYNAKLILYNGCHWIFDDYREIAEDIMKFVIGIEKRE